MQTLNLENLYPHLLSLSILFDYVKISPSTYIVFSSYRGIKIPAHGCSSNFHANIATTHYHHLLCIFLQIESHFVNFHAYIHQIHRLVTRRNSFHAEDITIGKEEMLHARKVTIKKGLKLRFILGKHSTKLNIVGKHKHYFENGTVCSECSCIEIC